MKKLLILGQIPKEYGGSYTTGVANVIIELSHYLKNNFETYIYATNLNENRGIINIEGVKFLGYSKTKLFRLFIIYLFKKGYRIFAELKDYKNHGLPKIKALSYRILIEYYIKKHKPDIINAHGMVFSPIIKNLGFSKRTFFSFHGFMYADPASIEAGRKRGVCMQKLYSEGAKNIKRPIYLTPEMKEKGEKELGIKSVNAQIISNGVNVSKFVFSEKSRHELRKLMNVKDNEQVYISVGALTNRKNHLGFIKFLIENNFEGHYWIIGKSESQETKDQIIKHAQESKRTKIKLINYVNHEELYKYYSAADLYSHPSTSEGQALVALEAMCCGLQLVVNEKIKGTLALDESYNDYIDYLNLDVDKLPEIKEFDREKFSKKCKRELSWKKSAEQYATIFTDDCR